MTVFVNGKEFEIEEGASFLLLLSQFSISKEERGVAVAIDSEVLLRQEWDQVELLPGMKIEIVHAVAGG